MALMALNTKEQMNWLPMRLHLQQRPIAKTLYQGMEAEAKFVSDHLRSNMD